ncbi:MAG TPA: response regulator transcription factor [Ktedonobacterales bacterium]
MRETQGAHDMAETLEHQQDQFEVMDETGAETASDGMVTPITVLLADDHALVREGTRRLLESEPDIRVVAEAGDGLEAVNRAQEVQPAVVIMDIAMPGMGGIEATRQIKARHPKVAVLALTAYDDEQYVLALLDAGAAGFLLKDVRGEELVAAVRAVHRGESVLQPRIAQRALLRAVSRRSPTASPAPLSEREMDVLREAARGLPNKDIAKRLNLSVRTIHTHLGNAFNKLGVGSRTEAVLLALRRGWISLDETELPPGMTTTSSSSSSSASAASTAATATPAAASGSTPATEERAEGGK